MKVTLLNTPSLEVCDQAIGKCWDKQAKDPVARIDRVVNKHKHSSTAEHIIYQFDIDGVSRALLQELARHRLASPTVKSSRYTLKELLSEDWFEGPYANLADGMGNPTNNFATLKARAGKYLVLTGDDFIDGFSVTALNNLKKALHNNKSNDIAKYCMPEAYKTSLVWTINARSLQNFLALRSSPAALWEIRNLAQAIFDQIPSEHRFLFEHCIKPGKEEMTV